MNLPLQIRSATQIHVDIYVELEQPEHPFFTGRQWRPKSRRGYFSEMLFPSEITTWFVGGAKVRLFFFSLSPACQ